MWAVGKEDKEKDLYCRKEERYRTKAGRKLCVVTKGKGVYCTKEKVLCCGVREGAFFVEIEKFAS